jgi:hypothetical protein
MNSAQLLIRINRPPDIGHGGDRMFDLDSFKKRSAVVSDRDMEGRPKIPLSGTATIT